MSKEAVSSVSVLRVTVLTGFSEVIATTRLVEAAPSDAITVLVCTSELSSIVLVAICADVVTTEVKWMVFSGLVSTTEVSVGFTTVEEVSAVDPWEGPAS